MSEDSTRTLPAEARVFGFDPNDVQLEVLPRSTSWRAVRAAGFAGGGLVLAPALGILPPHVVWIMGSVITGGVLGWRRWSERFTLIGLSGSCPKCGATLELPGPTRLRSNSTIECPGCRHDVQVVVTAMPSS